MTWKIIMLILLGRAWWMMANFLKGLFLTSCLMNLLRWSKMLAVLNKMVLRLMVLWVLLLAAVQLQQIMVQNPLLQSPRSLLVLIQTKMLSSIHQTNL
uniref:Uncharacterized protein n=1 Tax=Arundo donax TaxID=35708 RepID=A0A0A9B8J0_ARUDO